MHSTPYRCRPVGFSRRVKVTWSRSAFQGRRPRTPGILPLWAHGTRTREPAVRRYAPSPGGPTEPAGQGLTRVSFTLMVVDHIDGNKANNCRFNLRNCTRQENQRNRGKATGASSRFKGVYFDKKVRKWCAAITLGRRNVWLGYYTDEMEAARAYDRKAVELFGEFARLNFPEEWPPQRRAEVAKERERAEGRRQKATRRGDACVARTRKEQEHGGRKRTAEDRGRRTSERTRRRATAAKRSKRTTQNAQRKTSKRTPRRTTGHRSRGTTAKPRAMKQRVARRRTSA